MRERQEFNPSQERETATSSSSSSSGVASMELSDDPTPEHQGDHKQEHKDEQKLIPLVADPQPSAASSAASGVFLPRAYTFDHAQAKDADKKSEPAPWNLRRWVQVPAVVGQQPLHQIVGAFPHGKHHASTVQVESDIPFWVLPNVNRQWVHDLKMDSPLVFTRVPGRNHLALGRPTSASDAWILRMSILSVYLSMQFVLTNDGVPELHTSYPVLLPSRTKPIPMKIFRVQQWRNLVEGFIQMRLTPPIPEVVEPEQKELSVEQQAVREMKEDMQGYLDVTAYAVDYLEKQDQYHAGSISEVYLTSIADRMVLSPTQDCRFTMLTQTTEGKAHVLTGDGLESFEGVTHLPQTFNPLMNAQVFGRIEHVEELPGKLYGEGEEAYLCVVSVNRVPFEMFVLKSHVVVGTAVGKEAKEFTRGQRFWAPAAWLQCAHGVPRNAAGYLPWPSTIGPSAALAIAGPQQGVTNTNVDTTTPQPFSSGTSIAKESEELEWILKGARGPR